MDEDKIKESFKRIREDMEFFFQEMQELKRTFKELEQSMRNPTDNTSELDRKQGGSNTPTDNPTHILPLYALKSQIQEFSSGNKGVPTDRQTDQQTDNTRLTELIRPNNKDKTALEKASNLLDNLSETREELKQIFESLTQQELLVFSTIYQLEEQGEEVSYQLISRLLGLTESSIRDYIHRILKKGNLLVKNKQNNKKVIISVSPTLKKIASLSSIIQFKDSQKTS